MDESYEAPAPKTTNSMNFAVFDVSLSLNMASRYAEALDQGEHVRG